MKAAFDHLVFGAARLDEGARWLKERLGAPLSAGGEHSKMGTHNRLLKLSSFSYLELIAVNPEAPAPDQPRWFDLDAPGMAARLGTPCLLSWVASTKGLSDPDFFAGYDPGKVHAMSRNALSWLITFRDDGSRPEGGALPSLIEWPEGIHPATTLPDRGVTLKGLELRVPDTERVEAALRSIGLDRAKGGIRVIQNKVKPGLRTFLDTPRGPVWFDSSGLSGDGTAEV
jgi:Glyoxalase-like domain